DLRSGNREVLLGRGTSGRPGGPLGAPAARRAGPGGGRNEGRRPGSLGDFRDRALRRAHREMDGGPSTGPVWVGVTATLLGNGKVLLFGGEDPQGFPRPDVILFE